MYIRNIMLKAIAQEAFVPFCDPLLHNLTKTIYGYDTNWAIYFFTVNTCRYKAFIKVLCFVFFIFIFTYNNCA